MLIRGFWVHDLDDLQPVPEKQHPVDLHRNDGEHDWEILSASNTR